MTIYDTSKKQKIEFVPMDKNEVKIYVCGPTVYDDAHLGHARSAISFDLLRRTLIALGYNVVFAKNYTDIDDKIINKMKDSGESLEQITTKYIQRYDDEMATLNILPPDIAPKATQTIDDIVSFIQTLIIRGVAYKIDDGIYFDTSKDEAYLSLSGRVENKDDVQHRAGENEQKKDFKDFALWKLIEKSEVGFETPLGYGRPGWHIECSAMIDRFLASEGEFAIDIHGGGADLLFPHHENECAQTRCAKDQSLAKYWMHNGFVNINGQKMSKSLGNSFFIKDTLKNYNGEVLRFYLLSTHYRAILNFAEEDLIASKKRLDKLMRVKKSLYGVQPSVSNKEFKRSLLDALSDDLNISKALSVVDDMIVKTNEKLTQNPKDKGLKKESIANLELVKEVLGVGYMDAYEYFQFGIDEELKSKIETLIQQRSEAKKTKDFALSDSIREELASLGISLMDTPTGTLWEKC
jgi:cysteinyl-tRNA synthetase